MRKKYTWSEKSRNSIKNEGNHNWKGSKVTYKVLHQWVRRNIKKKEICEDCQKSPAFDLANISQKYKRDLSDWEWLCRKCHMKKDGRLTKLIKLRNSKKGIKLTALQMEKIFTPELRKAQSEFAKNRKRYKGQFMPMA